MFLNPFSTSVSTKPDDIKNIENMLELMEDNKGVKNVDCSGRAKVDYDAIWIGAEEKNLGEKK